MKEQIRKKSELNLRDAYDYVRITAPVDHFIPCELQEKEEDIIFTYDMEELQPLSHIRKEKEENKLLLLLDAM